MILTSPQNETRLEGDDAVFICIAEAEPLHTVQWFFQDTLLTASGTKYTIDDSSTGTYGRLTVDSVNQNDTGQYTCVVSNVHGNASVSAFLQVQGGHWVSLITFVNLSISSSVIPIFLENPAISNTRIVGENVSLSCQSFAIPTPSITWLKDGISLDLSTASLNVNFTVGVNTNASTLFLGVLNFSDSAQYSCRAENSLVSLQNTTSASGMLIVNCELVLHMHFKYHGLRESVLF